MLFWCRKLLLRLLLLLLQVALNTAQTTDNNNNNNDCDYDNDNNVDEVAQKLPQLTLKRACECCVELTLPAQARH